MANTTAKLSGTHSATGPSPSFIAGIGASAGGLEALEQMFSNMADDSSMAFVVIQHLSPDYKSLMVELLSKRTTMDVVRAENKMRVIANCIYLIPPKKIMTIANGHLLLKDKGPNGTLTLPINDFLISLAKDQGNKAIGIILSGTGSDGSLGVQAIKEAGGLVIIQDPDSAKFNGMPRSAIATGLVDYTLPPEKIPSILMRYSVNWDPGRMENSEWAVSDEEKLSNIFHLVKNQTGLDLSQYKASTALRRLQRRLQVNRLNSLSEYLDYLIYAPDEVHQLYNEMLIKVTNFFRDAEAFEVIGKILPSLIESKHRGEIIRVWSCGCSTGEEAYSLAILFHEAFEKLRSTIEVKIFATDLDRNSIEFASAGEYPADIANDIPKEYLQKYFEWDGEHYKILRTIRESVIFAPHNIIKDPPFTRIDLLCCRNLLIYLQPEIQRLILSNFGFSLRSNGYLFLGSSESIGEFASQFTTVDSRWKIYKLRQYDRSSFTNQLNFYREKPPVIQLPKMQRIKPSQSKSTILTEVVKALVDGGARSCAVVNEAFDIVYLFGAIEEYFSFSAGESSLNILNLVQNELSLALSMAFGRARKESKTIFCNGLDLTIDGKPSTVDLAVRRLVTGYTDQDYFLVLIDAIDRKQLRKGQGKNFIISEQAAIRVNELEDDLRFTQENLQATIEELETSNEELQATNEELLSSNEELQSTNEELQSVNEELYTVNTEYQNKIDELTELNNDIDNLLRCTDIGSIFLDNRGIIRRFTPAATQYVNLIDLDIGRSFFDLGHTLDYKNLYEDVRFAMTHLEPVNKEVKDRDGGLILLKIFPYLNESRMKNGIVINFVDVSSLTKLRCDPGRLDRKKDRILELLPDPIYYYDPELKLLWANRSGFKLLRQPAGEAVGLSADSIQQRITNQSNNHSPSRRAQQEGQEVHMTVSAADSRKWQVSAFPVGENGGGKNEIIEQWKKCSS